MPICDDSFQGNADTLRQYLKKPYLKPENVCEKGDSTFHWCELGCSVRSSTYKWVERTGCFAENSGTGEQQACWDLRKLESEEGYIDCVEGCSETFVDRHSECLVG